MRTKVWLGEKITIGFVIAFAALFVFSSLARRSIENTQSVSDWMTRALTVKTTLETLMTTIATVEAEQWGYAATADPSFLASYQAAHARVNPLVERLSSLIADNPQQRQRLAALTDLVRERLADVCRLVTLAHPQPAAALEQLGTYTGPPLTEAIRNQVHDLQASDQALLDQRIGVLHEQTRNALWLLDLSNVAAVMLAALAGFLIWRDLQKRHHTESQLQSSYDALEQRVQERTEELTRLNTTLVQLNTTLQETALAQEQARKENARLARYNQLLLESIGEGIYSIDAQGHCTFLNQRGAQMLGFAPEEVLGKDMHALIHHHRSDDTPYPVEECPIFQAMRTGEGCRIDTEVFGGRMTVVFRLSMPRFHWRARLPAG